MDRLHYLRRRYGDGVGPEAAVPAGWRRFPALLLTRLRRALAP